MTIDTHKFLGAVFMTVALLATNVALAQEADTLEPAVATSADTSRESRRPQVDGTPDGAERELIDPAVPSAVLAQDATRTQIGSQVMDRMELGRTEITGNQELPKVLYIVPWQKADPSDLLGRPVNSLLDEVLAPLDREEFVREVDYYNDLYGDEQ